MLLDILFFLQISLFLLVVLLLLTSFSTAFLIFAFIIREIIFFFVLSFLLLLTLFSATLLSFLLIIWELLDVLLLLLLIFCTTLSSFYLIFYNFLHFLLFLTFFLFTFLFLASLFHITAHPQVSSRRDYPTHSSRAYNVFNKDLLLSLHWVDVNLFLVKRKEVWYFDFDRSCCYSYFFMCKLSEIVGAKSV